MKSAPDLPMTPAMGEALRLIVKVLELRAASSRASPSFWSGTAPMPDFSIGAAARVCCDIAAWHCPWANSARLADRQ
jgi:hypothetical protein